MSARYLFLSRYKPVRELKMEDTAASANGVYQRTMSHSTLNLRVTYMLRHDESYEDTKSKNFEEVVLTVKAS